MSAAVQRLAMPYSPSCAATMRVGTNEDLIAL